MRPRRNQNRTTQRIPIRLTPATIEAFRDHGRLRANLEDNLEKARASLTALERVGISLNDVTDRLLEDGVAVFCKAFDSLLVTVQQGAEKQRDD